MLERDIQEAIDANLTSEVGKRLQARLARLEVVEKYLEEANKAIARKDKELKKLKKLKDICNSYANIAEREERLMLNERTLNYKEWELKVKEAKLEGRDLARQDNLAVIMAVFANNRLKYNESANVPAGLDQYGNARDALSLYLKTLEG